MRGAIEGRAVFHSAMVLMPNYYSREIRGHEVIKEIRMVMGILDLKVFLADFNWHSW